MFHNGFFSKPPENGGLACPWSSKVTLVEDRQVEKSFETAFEKPYQ